MSQGGKKVLFVTYGSGHVRMVIPVAKALAASGAAQPVVLALTTAADEVKRAGLPLVQIKDFVQEGDEQALAGGRELLPSLGSPPIDPDETAAYLGLCFSDLVAQHGLAQARAMYAQKGRQAFLPVPTLRRILNELKPDVLFATNSPRAERAAVLAAREAGIPALCLIDLFAIDEIEWIGEPNYADCICVLNDSVKAKLVAAGRSAEQIHVTGNPAFDALFALQLPQQAQALKTQHQWQGKQVVLWASQFEPAVHPFNGKPGDPHLPAKALQILINATLENQNRILCVRLRPGEHWPAEVECPNSPRIVLTGQDWALPPLLHAADLVATLSSTVGLEGHLVGCRVVQVLGSVFDHAMPMREYGISDQSVSLYGLEQAVSDCLALPRRDASHRIAATHQVLKQLCYLVAACETSTPRVQ
jgi:hypothetical protein